MKSTTMPLCTAMFLVGLIPLGFAYYDSPLDQLKDGTPINEITCKEGKMLLERNSKPYCVGVDTTERLKQRGWNVVEQAPRTVVEPPAEPRAEPPATPVNIAVTSLQTESPVTPKDIPTANNAFAVDFYRQVSADTREDGKNIFFSPASMYTAFSLLYEGARGDTASQMEYVFGFNPDVTTRHNDTVHMMASVNRDDPHATLNLANALWLAEWFEPHNSYLDIVRGTYFANVEKVSFPGDVDKINQWASNNTNGKIDEVITKDDVDGTTTMVINNAIYFNGTWLTQFPKEDTHESDFWNNSTESVKTDFMHVTGTFNYTTSDGVQVLKMPYKGDRLSMQIVLPVERDGIEQLQEKISSHTIQKWQHDLRETEVVVLIPKFEVKTKYNLGAYLVNLGMADVFHEKSADLLGIIGIEPSEEYVGRNLYVSKAIQDAYVKVNEEGTEAAAVTTITVKTESLALPPPRFTADHPFIFIIQDDESGMILFMGRVSDPTA